MDAFLPVQSGFSHKTVTRYLLLDTLSLNHWILDDLKWHAMRQNEKHFNNSEQLLDFLRTKSTINHLEQVQRRTARFVHRNYWDRTPGNVSHMVRELGWPPLMDRRLTHRLIMLYQIQRGLVDINPGSILRKKDKCTRGGHRIYQPVAPQQLQVLVLSENHIGVEQTAGYNYRQSNSRSVHSCHPSHWCRCLCRSLSRHSSCF